MRFLRDFKFNRGFELKWLVIDALVVGFSLVLGLGIRFLEIVWWQDGMSLQHYQYLFDHYIEVYFFALWLVLPVSLITFGISGFYTRDHSFSNYYKVLIIFRAVSIGYLVSGFILYIFSGKGVQLSFGISGFEFPRSAFIFSWIMTIIFIFIFRFWAEIRQRVFTKAEKAEKAVLIERRINKNILVIGGAGYIGSALLKYLLDRGYNVRLMDILLYGSEPIKNIMAHPKLEVIQADFRHVERVYEAIQDMDIIVHLGAIVGDPACDLNKDMTIQINTTATKMIAEIAQHQRVERFIFSSTCSVYGVSDKILNENAALKPLSLYAQSKLSAEQTLLNMASPDFHPVILRFGTLYGFSERVRFDLVVNLLTAKAVIDKQIMILGGNQWRPFLHVQDAAYGILKIIETPQRYVQGEIFNIGSNEQNYRIRDIGHCIKSIIPSAKIIYEKNKIDKRDYRINFEKIKNLTGFQPNWTLEKGIQQVAKRLKSGQINDYQNHLYSNAQFLLDEGVSKLQIYPTEWVKIEMLKKYGTPFWGKDHHESSQ